MSELALKLIAENKLTKSPFLDLGKSGLENYLPDELFDCIWLQELNLGNWKMEKNKKIKTEFKWSKKSSDLLENSIESKELEKLKNLPKLEMLALRELKLNDIKFIYNLRKIKYLDVSQNPNLDFDIFEKLDNIYNLMLYDCNIKDTYFLKNLTHLKRIGLGQNHIIDINFLEGYSNLSSLYLHNNQINDISILTNLKQLQRLTLQSNQIDDSSLSNIFLFENLINLQFLNITRNKITNLKPFISLAKRNFNFDFDSHDSELEHNAIGLKNNPITNPPLEIVKQGRDKIIEYFEGQRKPLNECKLIFVGDGGVGKTSLMRRVVFDDFKKNEITTHGINKIAWEEIENDINEKVRVNLWDFGGQHIQHSLHQFFFTERVIYVLVLNPRNDLKANYWLDQIDKLGCDSEILIVYNWKQEEDKQADFLNNFYELRKKYPKLPEPFLLSCETGEGVESFKKALVTSVLRNEGLKTEYLVKWFNIKQRLEKEVSVGKNYITYETYQEWCNAVEYNEPDRQKSLLKILDSVGSIVFFDKPILEQLQVLNPEWLTTGAYSILVSKQNRENKGHLSWEDLKAIFNEEKEIFSDKAIKIKYTENQFLFILELMLQYDLCQRNPFKQNEFLLPSAFGEKPNKDYSFAKEDARYYRLQFDSPFEMLIIHRFIAKNLLKITDKDYWQSGIYIKHPDSDTYALVETNLYSKRIDCWVKGYNIRGFWEVIRADFREILSIYHKFTFKEEVLYKKDDNEVFLPYDEMLNALRNGKKIIDYHPTYGIENIDVLAVLDLFEDKSQTQRIMEQNDKRIVINNSPTFNNNPHFEQKNENKNTLNLKIDVSSLKEFAEIKELLLDLEGANIKNEDWKNALIKALDEFNKLEVVEEKASQKTSISIIERTVKTLKNLKDGFAIGFLTVDVEKKWPTLLEQWDAFKQYF